MNSEKIHPYSKYTFVHDQYLEYYVYKKQVYELQGKALKIIHKLPALGATKALYQEVTKDIVKKSLNSFFNAYIIKNTEQ